MTVRDTLLLFLLGALWGSSFLFVRIAVPVLGPFPLVEVRVLVGGLILLVYAAWTRQAPDFRRYGGRIMLLGLINNAVPFVMIAFAQLRLTASLAALINATVPLFSAVVAAIWIRERLTVPKLVGLFLGLVGVLMIVGWRADNLDPSRVGSILLSLGASLCYGVAVVYSKVAFRDVRSVSIATGQLLAASAWVLPLALLNPVTKPVSGGILLAVLGLAVLATSAAYLIYFYLIEHAGPTNAASSTLLIPFFSALWGAVFLGERLQPNELAGFAIILVSLLLVTGLWRRVVPNRAQEAVS